MKTFLLAAIIALFNLSSVFADTIVDGNVTMLLLNEDKSPIPGLTYSGECTSKKESSIFSEKINNKLFCVSDSKGFCSFQYKTYEISNEKYAPCNESESIITDRNGIKVTGPISSFGGRFSNGKLDVLVSITKTNNKWRGEGEILKSPDRFIFYNAIYFYSKDDFEKFQQLDESFEYYFSRIKIKDDEFESVATISSENSQKSSSFGFLRVFVAKKSKKVSYQVYVRDVYYDYSFKNYVNAKYISLGEPRLLPVLKLSKDVDCSNKISGQCRFEEQIGFDLDDDSFADILDKYKSEPNGVWKYKISPNSGSDIIQSIKYIEFAAIARKVEEYLRK